MSNSEQDPMLRRAIEELRALPPANEDAIRRVVTAAAAARLAPADESVAIDRGPGRSVRMWSALGMAAAAAIIGFVARGAWTSRSSAPIAMTAVPIESATPQTVLRSASSSAAESGPILQQFVFNDGGAHRVAVVGDFNKWNPQNAQMTRTPDGASWSTMIPIVPVRHIYGFMVDDSVFVLDPRAPKMRDADLGTEGSVVIVGRP
jgi:hypothetical protein